MILNLLRNGILLFILAAIASGTAAATYTYRIDAEYESSDNLSQRVDGESGHANNLGLGFTLNSDPNTDWLFEASGAFSKSYYSQDELQDDENRLLQGIARYRPKSNNFRLGLLANLSQEPRNRLQAQEVNNLRDTNLWAAQPGYFISISRADKINFRYTWLDYDVEDVEDVLTAQDNSRRIDEASIGYERRINETNALALILQESDNDFEQSLFDGAIDYKQQDAFLRWIVRGRTNQFQIEAGRSRIDDDLMREIDVDHSSILWTRQVNRNQTLEFGYFEGIDAFFQVNQATDEIIVNINNTDVTQAQEARGSYINYSYNSTFWQVNLSAYKNAFKEIFTNERDKLEGYTFGVNYSLARAFNTPLQSQLQFSYSRDDNEFGINLATDDTTTVEVYRLRYNHAFSRRFFAYLELSSRDSNQVTGAALPIDIEADSIFLGFAFTDNGRF